MTNEINQNEIEIYIKHGFTKSEAEKRFGGMKMRVGKRQREFDINNEKEKMDKEAHRKTIFSAGAKREGLMDKPYDEGEVL